MAFMFSLEKAKCLLEDPLSCFKCITTTKRITLPHYFVGDHRQGAKEFLNLGLKRYSESLDGILITYYDTMILSRNGCIMDDLPYFTFNVRANFILFRPHVGSVLKGIVNKLSPDHIGCLVHGHFNASIFKKHEEEWDTPQVRVGCVVTFEVTSLDLCSKIIFIRGKLMAVEDPDPDFLLENHNEDSKANIAFSSPSSLRKIKFDSDTDQGSEADVAEVVQLDVAEGSGEEKTKKGRGKNPVEKMKKKKAKDKTNGKEKKKVKNEEAKMEKAKANDKTKGKVKTKGDEDEDGTAGIGDAKDEENREELGEDFEGTSKIKENAQKPKSPQKKGKVTHDISNSDGEDDAMKGKNEDVTERKKAVDEKRGSPKIKEDESKGKEKAAANSSGKKVGSPTKRKTGPPKQESQGKGPGGGLDLSTFEEAEISRIFEMAEIEVGRKRKRSGSEEAKEMKRSKVEVEEKTGTKKKKEEKTGKKKEGVKKTKEEKKRERVGKKKAREEKKKVREEKKKEREEKKKKKEEKMKKKEEKNKKRKNDDGKDKDEKMKKRKKDNKGKKEGEEEKKEKRKRSESGESKQGKKSLDLMS